MADEASEGGGPQRVDVTRDTVEALAAKLDTFGEDLPDEERAVLRSVLNAGMQVLSSEVKGFMDIESFSWGLTSPWERRFAGTTSSAPSPRSSSSAR